MVNRTGYGALLLLHMLQTQHQGGNTYRCDGIFSTTPHHARIIHNRASYQGSQGTDIVLKNPVPQSSFTIREIQLHAIDISEKLFNTMQPEKTQAKVLPREVPTIAPSIVPITVPPPRVPSTVAPPRAMSPRVSMIPQEDLIEDIRQRNTVENNKQQQLKHRYPTRKTKTSQDINQVDSTATTSTRHQHWIMNMHEQVNDTQKFIENCIK